MDGVDLTDLRIIRYLQDRPRASYADIARHLATSHTTIKRRVETLIDAGVLIPAMIPEIYKLGFGASAFAGLTIDLGEIDRIAERLTDLPQTTLVASTMGRFDLVLFVAAPSIEQLSRFLVDEVASIHGVKSIETLVAPRMYKQRQDWRIPIDRLLEEQEDGFRHAIRSAQ